MLLVLMLLGLVLSTSIPTAFEGRGLVFAAAYATMQVGRSLFVLWTMRRHNPVNYLNFQRITAWLLLSAVFWLSGGFAESETSRFLLWAVALALETAAPMLGFWTPGFGRSTTADWDVEGGHLAERAGLFIIMALGESIVVIGAAFADLAWTPEVVGAVAASFIGSVAMWWLYFNIGADKASHDISLSSDPGSQARLGYTYIHLLPVAGIIVSAVADELVLAHPSGHTDIATTAAALLGGAGLYLFGMLLFKWTVYGRPPLSHMIGLVLLALLVPAVSSLSPLTLSAVTSVVLVIVAIWETLSLRPRRQGASVD
jgi:low temperature requirement protein LtrA